MSASALAALVGTLALVALLGAVGSTRLARVRRSVCASRTSASPRPAAARRTTVRHRQRQRRLERQLDATFPELLDVLVVSIQGGLLPAQALAAATTHVDGPLRAALDALDDRLARGQRFADALPVLVDQLGPRALGMVATITSTERHGLPLGPALERLADDARAQRRRHAEAAARELPVRLAFPLVLCTLPSFALVAIVPLLTGALSSLRSS